MSFWPRLRKRSTRGRKRGTSTKANPYASNRENNDDKYVTVHEELQLQRAQFASEKGVSVSVVRLISRSSRGWVYLPSDSPPHTPLSPGSSHDGIVNPSATLQGFALPPPALPLPPTIESTAQIGNEEGASSSGSQSGAESSSVMGSDSKRPSKNAGKLVHSRKLKDQAWRQINKTAAVLLVKVLVFSRSLGASTAFAFTVAVVVDTWKRGKATFQLVFSALAAQVLTKLKSYLSLQQRVKSSIPLIHPAAKPAAQSSAPRRSCMWKEMKASSMTRSSSVLDSSTSSLVLPVLARKPSSVAASSSFSEQQQRKQEKGNTSTKVESPAESASSVVSPLVESNKLRPTTKSCQKLKSKLFKSSPTRKGENSRPSSPTGESGSRAESSAASSSSSSSSSGASSSSAGAKGGKKKSSSTGRKGSKVGDELEQQVASLSAPKVVTRSHDLSFFRSRKESSVPKDVGATSSAPPAAGVKNLSRSQELKGVFKSLGRKKVSRSQEFTASSPPSPRIEGFALPTSTVDSLQALAFPFREERASTTSSTGQSPPKSKSCLVRMISGDSSDEKVGSKALESAPSSPKTINKGAKFSAASSASTSKSPPLGPAAAEVQPGLRNMRTANSLSSTSEHQVSDLRKVKTTVGRNPPLPSQTGELGRSEVMSREILGSLLLLAVLGFLLLGRVPAILGTACFCLVLSQFQRFFAKNLTPRDKELRRRNSGISRLQHATSSPANWQSNPSGNSGSQFHDKSGLQSSAEYRKRVLMEGLLDRGNRRGFAS